MSWPMKLNLLEVKYFIKEANAEDAGSLEEAKLCRKVCGCPGSKEPLEVTFSPCSSLGLCHALLRFLFFLLGLFDSFTLLPPTPKLAAPQDSALGLSHISLCILSLNNHIHAQHCSCQAHSDDF